MYYALDMSLLAYLHWHMIQWGLVSIFTWLNGLVCDMNVMVVNYSWERYVVVRRDYCAGTGIVNSSYFTLTVHAIAKIHSLEQLTDGM